MKASEMKPLLQLASEGKTAEAVLELLCVSDIKQAFELLPDLLALLKSSVKDKTIIEESEAYRLDLLLNLADSALESLLELETSVEKKNIANKFKPLV